MALSHSLASNLVYLDVSGNIGVGWDTGVAWTLFLRQAKALVGLDVRNSGEEWGVGFRVSGPGFRVYLTN
jgi:UPF0716 family protein affecting phage T7 exclusion